MARSKIDHEPGSHDDYINAVAGLAHVFRDPMSADIPLVSPGLFTESQGWISEPRVLSARRVDRDGLALRRRPRGAERFATGKGERSSRPGRDRIRWHAAACQGSHRGHAPRGGRARFVWQQHAGRRGLAQIRSPRYWELVSDTSILNACGGRCEEGSLRTRQEVWTRTLGSIAGISGLLKEVA